jgi:hypothetical protein
LSSCAIFIVVLQLGRAYSVRPGWYNAALTT